MGQGILLFDNASGSGSAQTYLQDAFQDIALPANSNAGFSSTVSRNPFSNSYGNDNIPKYAAKTLWIKDLVLVQDRTKWINDRPTYQIVWHEDFPGAQGYCFGTVALSLNAQGNRLDLKSVGDGFGVGGIIRRVQWIVESQTAATATAQQSVDGANTTTIDFSLGATGWDGQPKFNPYNHASANETRDIHDFRLSALQVQTLSVTGVVVYYEITGQAIDCFGGTSYLNKTQVVTLGASLALPSITNLRGGRAAIFKTATSGYGLTTTIIPDVVSVATGTSGTNLLSLTPGTGASFPAGTAVWAQVGASHYIGNVLSQSSDTLTMGVTLPFGVSASLYQIWQAGHTAFPVGGSLFTEAFQYNAALQIGTNTATYGVFAFADKNLNWRLWGGTLQTISGASVHSSLGASYGIDLYAASSILQIDGRYQALEFEFMAGPSAVLKATIMIDGMAAYNFNDNINGPGFFRKTIMTNAGPGWHQVTMQKASGMTQILVSRVVGYRNLITNGPSFGNLAHLDFGQTFLPQNAINTSKTAFGNIRRVFADSIYFKGPWSRVLDPSAAGGVYFVGSTTTCSAQMSYYGSQLAIVGVSAGAFTVTFDGLGTSNLMGIFLGASLGNGFHTFNVAVASGTMRIDAIDVLRPLGEIKWLPTFPLPYNADQLEAPNGVLGIKAGGVGRREIANFSVDRSQMAPVNQVVSSSSGSFNTSANVPTDVTNLTAQIESKTGRPIVMELIPDGELATGSELQYSKSTTGAIFGYLLFLRNGVALCQFRQGWQFGTAVAFASPPVSSFRFEDDNPPAGTNTYSVQVYALAGTVNTAVTNVKLKLTEKA